MLSRLIAVAMVIALASPGYSETWGTITASIGGEAERTWFITGEGDESQSSFIQVMPGKLSAASFILWGTADEPGDENWRDVMHLRATLMPEPGGFAAVSNLDYMEEFNTKYWTADAENSEVVLSVVEQIDGNLHVAGTFTAEAIYAEGYENIDPTRTTTIVGRFDVTLPMD